MHCIGIATITTFCFDHETVAKMAHFQKKKNMFSPLSDANLNEYFIGWLKKTATSKCKSVLDLC